MAPPRTLTFGECLFDDLPSGRRPGGGPLNAAAHLCALGTETGIITAVGVDESGEQLRDVMLTHGVDTRYVQTNDLPTGRVGVTVGADGEAHYQIDRPVAWDAIAAPTTPLPTDLTFLACWLLGLRDARTLATFTRLVDDLPAGCQVVADLGLRPPHTPPERAELLLRRASIVKLNRGELATLTRQLGHAGDDPRVLAEAYGLETLIVTLGPEGGAVSFRQNVRRHCPGQPVRHVADTVGCGDAFLAGYLEARLRGLGEPDCLAAGCRRGAYAATVAGGLPNLARPNP